MGKRLNIQFGNRFGYLTIIEEKEPLNCRGYKKRMFLCKCDCGETTATRLEYLTSSHTTSCGCKSKKELSRGRKRHDYSGTRLYSIWNGMKGRCYNPKRKSYKDYGEKGVSVCPEWHDFVPFKGWALNNGYQDDLTIERVDPYGNYEPDNCTWIPKSEQGKNKRGEGKVNDYV